MPDRSLLENRVNPPPGWRSDVANWAQGVLWALWERTMWSKKSWLYRWCVALDPYIHDRWQAQEEAERSRG